MNASDVGCCANEHLSLMKVYYNEHIRERQTIVVVYMNLITSSNVLY